MIWKVVDYLMNPRCRC